MVVSVIPDSILIHLTPCSPCSITGDVHESVTLCLCRSFTQFLQADWRSGEAINSHSADPQFHSLAGMPTILNEIFSLFSVPPVKYYNNILTVP
jgi:hypothetical protein